MTQLSEDAKSMLQVISACMYAGLTRQDAMQEVHNKAAELGWTPERRDATIKEMMAAGGIVLDDAAILATMAIDCSARGLSPRDGVVEVRKRLKEAGWSDDRIHGAEQGFLGAMRP